METVNIILRRDEGEFSPDIVNKLLVVFLVLLVVCIACVGILFLLRKRRQSQKKATLPLYTETDGNLDAPRRSHHRRVSSVTISSSVPYSQRKSKTMFVDVEKQDSMDKDSSQPSSPVPQIRVTFPEEVDDHGKTQSGRSVVVHIGEQGNMGMEPVHEKLPPYTESDRFVSLDLERIGGLKEKPIPPESRPT
ncbi:MAG: hypothetical protein M1831_004616 [Alyxoria varia]|nr:MAG: hypothetical protein M1831_004616 [Alyxoria varia]